ncbi:MAG: hypothetical protein ACOX0Z_01795 [Candidatus Nanosyncoccaceae bacterium]|jgi:Fe2+ or Zn2+ uptake regulation protein
MAKKPQNTIKNLFGSTTRIKLLELFFTNFDKQFYVREITRLINEQINSVRRELANLEQIGVVKKTEKDNKVYYRADQKFRYYVAFAMIFDENFDHQGLSRSTIRELEKEANVAPQPADDKFDWQKVVARSDDYLQVAILAGRLVPDSESEIDMLLVGDNSKREISAWATSAEKVYGKGLAYSVIPYDEFVYRQSIRDKFVMQVLSGPYVVIKDIVGVIDKAEG